MGEWIRLQQVKEQEKEQTQLKKAEPVPCPMISVSAQQHINMTKKESSTIPEKELEMAKERLKQEALAKQLQREKQYQEKLRAKNKLMLQLEELNKLIDSDTCSDEDYATRDTTERSIAILKHEMEELEKTHTFNVKLDESLLPKTASFTKDKGMSL